MKLTKEEARDLISGDLDGWEEVTITIENVLRWDIHYSGIFKHGEKYYSLSWLTGATEMQDIRPFEYEEPELIEVAPVEEIVTRYVTYRGSL